MLAKGPLAELSAVTSPRKPTQRPDTLPRSFAEISNVRQILVSFVRRVGFDANTGSRSGTTTMLPQIKRPLFDPICFEKTRVAGEWLRNSGGKPTFRAKEKNWTLNEKFFVNKSFEITITADSSCRRISFTDTTA